eukprot:TRINITY_DN26720_c0_g1_i1.p1 TRINITY_DN26720_c0_g1~~TRINITY_DN26720_c0_g1_i1.p1  ORF type:complete len:121 (-),score=12.14 TRINITY_DN26720_c0_g1_i1:64-372(-)
MAEEQKIVDVRKGKGKGSQGSLSRVWNGVKSACSTFSRCWFDGMFYLSNFSWSILIVCVLIGGPILKVILMNQEMDRVIAEQKEAYQRQLIEYQQSLQPTQQ